MESSSSNHPDLQEIVVLLEDLLEKCCMHVDGMKLSQKEPISQDPALDKKLNYNAGGGDTVYKAAESARPTDKGKMKEVQLLEPMPLTDSLLIKDDEIVINQIMVSLLDKCCANIQEKSDGSYIGDQSGKESDKVEQKNSDIAEQDTSIGEEDPNIVENQKSNQNDLEKGSLIQKFIIQKNSFVDIQTELNPPSTTEEKREQEVFKRETLSKSRDDSFTGTVSDEEPVEVIDVEDNDTGKEADDFNARNTLSVYEMNLEKNVLVNNALPLNTLCSNFLKQYPAEIQHLLQPESLKILALRHNRDQKVCQTHLEASKVDTACIKEQDLGEGKTAMLTNNVQEKAVNSDIQMKTEALERRIDDEKNKEWDPLEMNANTAEQEGKTAMLTKNVRDNTLNSDIQMKTEALEKRNKEWDPLEMTSNTAEQEICENKMTFVQSLGLSPLIPIEKALEDESSAVFQQLHSLFQGKENTVEPREIDTHCTENEVFGKIEIEEELLLEMDETIPCKKLKLEDDASDKVYQSSKKQIAICQMSLEANKNPSEGVHDDLMANTPVLKESTLSSNITIHVGDESSKHNAVVEYVEPQINLQETKFENTSKVDANNNRKEVGGPFGHNLRGNADLNKGEDLVVGEVQYRLQSREQLVPSTVNTVQTLTEDVESFYEEENPKFEKSPDFYDKETDWSKETGDNTKVNDSAHGVTDRTKCFKWKYTPSYDTDAVVPNTEQADCGSPCRIMPITSCKKPIRLGLSRRQSRVVSLHPYIKKH